MELMYQGDYSSFKTELDTELRKSAEGFVKIGYLLKVARDTDILRGKYDNVVDFAHAEYGLDKSQVSRFIRINDKFSIGGNSDRLETQYQGIGQAKLAVMLQLPDAVNEEITPAFTRSELNEIKEEIQEEEKITPMEVMLEEKDKSVAGLDDLTAVLKYILEDNTDIFRKCFEGKIKEGLTPDDEAIYSTRIPGKGRYMLSLKPESVNLVNIRSSEKQGYTWENIENAISLIIPEAEDVNKAFFEAFGHELEEVAPVQPVEEKKSKVVTQKKPDKTKPKKPENVEKTLWQKPQPNVVDISKIGNPEELRAVTGQQSTEEPPRQQGEGVEEQREHQEPAGQQGTFPMNEPIEKVEAEIVRNIRSEMLKKAHEILKLLDEGTWSDHVGITTGDMLSRQIGELKDLLEEARE